MLGDSRAVSCAPACSVVIRATRSSTRVSKSRLVSQNLKDEKLPVHGVQPAFGEGGGVGGMGPSRVPDTAPTSEITGTQAECRKQFTPFLAGWYVQHAHPSELHFEQHSSCVLVAVCDMSRLSPITTPAVVVHAATTPTRTNRRTNMWRIVWRELLTVCRFMRIQAYAVDRASGRPSVCPPWSVAPAHLPSPGNRRSSGRNSCEEMRLPIELISLGGCAGSSSGSSPAGPVAHWLAPC
jgi:hypothetical protein